MSRAVVQFQVLNIPVFPLTTKAGSLTAGGLQQEAQPVTPWDAQCFLRTYSVALVRPWGAALARPLWVLRG